MVSVAPAITAPPSCLLADYDVLGSVALQAHFRSRRGVNYFPVLNAEATTRGMIDAVVAGQFEFNHEIHKISNPVDWLRNPSVDIEWHILLHKFYYAVGLGKAFKETGSRRYLDRWVELTSSWMEQTPPGFIASDVTGRRVQNWIYAFYFFVEHADAELPEGFLRRFLQSLAEQVEFLIDNLATARNHRTLELYAIFLAAIVFPEMHGADRWRRFSFRELLANMRRDLLPDGTHCEMSTDYHHVVLRNFLCVRRLAARNDMAFPPAMDLLLEKALEFAMHIHRPDGIVPALSDGDARSYLELLQQGHTIYGREDFLYVATAGKQGQPPEQRSKRFRDSGYCVLRSGWGTAGEYHKDRYLVFDCGPLGEGNHGHLDLLSIELSAYGNPLVVDPGRYTYDESGPVNWRARFRGTHYHNTVVVDDRNQTAYSQGSRKFKISGQQPAHEIVAFATAAACDVVHGRAASYEYDAVHDRCIFFVAGEYWFISDWLTSSSQHRYEQRFHLAAMAEGQTARRSDGDSRIEAPGLTIVQRNAGRLEAGIERGYVSTSYGHKQAAPVACFAATGNNFRFDTALVPHEGRRPIVRVATVPVTMRDSGEPQDSCWCTQVTTQHANALHNDLLFIRPEYCDDFVEFAGFRYSGNYLALRVHADGSYRVLYADNKAALLRHDCDSEPEPGR